MNFLLTLAYDGTNYCGFQVQPNGRSVAAVFQDALEAVLGTRPDIKGCSRTDAGVHALGFRLNFHADTRIPPEKLPLALNQHLPPDIRVLAARVVPEDFHARYAAHTKTYLYRIHNHPIDSPFDAAYYTRMPKHLDEVRMQAAAQQFVGTHDFLALCAAGSSAAAHGDTVRTITDCHVTRRGDEIDSDGGRLPVQHGAHSGGHLVRSGRGPDAAGTDPRHPGRLRPQPGGADPAGKGAVPEMCGIPGYEGEPFMRKIHRGSSPAEGEPLSAGRVEYLEAARQRARSRRLRRGAIIVAVLTVLVLFATGAVGTSIARAKDLVDSVHITLTPNTGWPQQTGITEPTAVAKLSGGFAEMDTDTCVVYSFGGAKLNSVQSGYARPALAAGKSRFVLYNRSGNELRVESRTQNLYTKTLDSSIYLCAVADAGQVAVATDDTDSVAKLTVYSSAMEQVLSWNLTSAEGTPLRMAFSPDSRRIAVAAVTANGGQLTTNLYVLALAQGDPVQLGTATSVPQWLGWLSGDSVLALYEDRAVLYGANGGEKASYDFGGSTLVDVDTENGGVALLLSGGQTCTAVLLDNSLGVQYSGNVPAASHILRAADGFYLLTDSTVECFNKAGEFQWTQPMDAKPQAGVLNGRQLLVFSGNTVQQVTAPEPDSSSAS